jgi:hypothetical protein
MEIVNGLTADDPAGLINELNHFYIVVDNDERFIIRDCLVSLFYLNTSCKQLQGVTLTLVSVVSETQTRAVVGISVMLRVDGAIKLRLCFTVWVY